MKIEDKEFADRVVQQAMDMWINPEIARRRALGALPDVFAPFAMQVIFDDVDGVEVRFDREVKVTLAVEYAREMSAGELVTTDDIEDITDIRLTGNDANAGHFTFFRKRDGWVIAFDFTRNVSRSVEFLAAAREFMTTADQALQAGRLRSFAENLFGAVELGAKGLLIMHDSDLLQSRKHGAVASRFNRWGHFGNTDPEFTRLLNRLQGLRDKGRYLHGEFALPADEAQQMLVVAGRLLDELAARISYSRRATPESTDTPSGLTPN